MIQRSMMALAGALAMAMVPVVAWAGGPKDMVNGSATFAVDDSRATVQARSEADGTRPRGSYRIAVGDPPLDLAADVVCLHVDGNEAVVGAVVTSSSNVSLVPIGTGLLHYVEDNGSPGTLDASVTNLFVPAEECATFASLFDLQAVQTGNWVVRDR